MTAIERLSEFHYALLESLAILESNTEDPIRGRTIRDLITGDLSLEITHDDLALDPQYVSAEDGLSQIFDVDAPAASHFYSSLDDLEEEGLLKKYPRCPDGRSNSYELTEDGRRMVELRFIRSAVAHQGFANLAGD